MSKKIRIKKGLNIPLKGKAEKVTIKHEPADTYAVKPSDFKDILPKIVAKEGETVKAGSVLFFDKKRPDIKFTSPVSGQVKEIIRGEKRKILEIVIQANPQQSVISFDMPDIEKASREELVQILLDSGLWTSLRQRPFQIIPDPTSSPRDIFISCFDKAPLAPDLDFMLHGNEKSFETGLACLKRLTSGAVYLGINADYRAASIFSKPKNVIKHEIEGKYPASNVGIQIHHIKPILPGEKVWTIHPLHVIFIGRLFEKGHLDMSRMVAITGSEVIRPRYHKIISGTSVKHLLKDNIQKGNVRYISGNVLTGKTINNQGHLGFFDDQITVIPEGNHHELMGWAAPGFNKFSTSRTFFSWLMPWKKYRMDTNYHGGERTFIFSGQYEKVLPMNIYPVHLLKAILAKDLDLMENLGMHEVVEEDFAVCEYVCASKIEVQAIIQEGIDFMIKELN